MSRNRIFHACLCALAFLAALDLATAPAVAQCEEVKLTYSNAVFVDLLGWTVDMDGRRFVAGTNPDGGNTQPRIVLWERIGDEWQEQTALWPNDLGDADYRPYGFNVAISGDVIAGGGWTDYSVHRAGLVEVYRRQGAHWIRQQRIEPFPPETTTAEFGMDVEVSGDFLFIGCPICTGAANRGVSVYRFTGSSWSYLQLLTTGEPGTMGGRIAADGDWAAVNAYHSDTDVYAISMFQFDGNAWIERQIIPLPPGEANWFLSQAIDLRGDRMILGSVNQQPGELGHARIYRCADELWVEEASFTSPDPDFYYYGYSVGVDGDVAVVGSIREYLCGALHVYERVDEQWGLRETITAPGPCADQVWGYSVSLAWPYAVVGAPLDNQIAHASGAVHVLDFEGADCNKNGICDATDIANGTSIDLDGDGIPEECDCVGDLNGDRVVNLADLAQLLSHYHAAEPVTYYEGDLDFDGDVDLVDLAEMLSHYGDTCPWPM